VFQHRIGTQIVHEPPDGVTRLARIRQNDAGAKSFAQSLQRIVGRACSDDTATVKPQEQRQTLTDIVGGID